MRVLSLFSGIGGLDLAAEWAGMKIVAMCEIEPYAIKVLERRFPNVPIFGDVTTVTRNTLTEHGIEPDGIDCIIGGFPCQPFSVAGKRKGKADKRFLWGEFNRLIGEIRPSWVVAENVPGLISIALDDILASLESKGYGCSRLYIRLRLSAHPTNEKGSLLWPTATSRDYKDGTAKSCANVPVNCLLGRAVHRANCGQRQIVRIGEVQKANSRD